MIRSARLTDRAEVVALLKEGHTRSRYAKVGYIVENIVEQFVRELIKHHGAKTPDGTLCNVIECEGKIVGLHFAAKERIKIFGSKYYASDALFYVQPGHGFETMGLINRFMEWANADPRVIEIVSGVTDDIDDPEDAAKLYEKIGFKRCGSMLRQSTGSAA